MSEWTAVNVLSQWTREQESVKTTTKNNNRAIELVMLCLNWSERERERESQLSKCVSKWSNRLMWKPRSLHSTFFCSHHFMTNLFKCYMYTCSFYFHIISSLCAWNITDKLTALPVHGFRVQLIQPQRTLSNLIASNAIRAPPWFRVKKLFFVFFHSTFRLYTILCVLYVHMNIDVLSYHWLVQQMKIGTGVNPCLNQQELCHK